MKLLNRFKISTFCQYELKRMITFNKYLRIIYSTFIESLREKREERQRLGELESEEERESERERKMKK